MRGRDRDAHRDEARQDARAAKDHLQGARRPRGGLRGDRVLHQAGEGPRHTVCAARGILPGASLQAGGPHRLRRTLGHARAALRVRTRHAWTGGLRVAYCKLSVSNGERRPPLAAFRAIWDDLTLSLSSVNKAVTNGRLGGR